MADKINLRETRPIAQINGYQLYEDPDEGDEAPLWALSPSGHLAQTDFYELDPEMFGEDYLPSLFGVE